MTSRAARAIAIAAFAFVRAHEPCQLYGVSRGGGDERIVPLRDLRVDKVGARLGQKAQSNTLQVPRRCL
eukprot:4031621-Prymnesium_polylepis.2